MSDANPILASFQLVDLDDFLHGLLLVSFLDLVDGAGAQVAFKQHVFNPGKRLLHGGGLCDDINAIRTTRDELAQASDLPFRNAEAAKNAFCILAFHKMSISYTPSGYHASAKAA